MPAAVGLLVGAWAVLPAYTGPALNTTDRVEFVDHVVPGIAVMLISATALLLAGRFRTGVVLFAAGLAVALAGFWMTATHLPLMLQATRAEAPWDATIYHSVPGLAVLALGVVWTASYRDTETT